MTSTFRRLIAAAATTAIAALALAACAGGGAAAPVSESDLVGTWTVAETFETVEQPYVDFVADGTWTASDGCNHVAGTWKLGDGGSLTTTAGPMTLIGCDGAPLPTVVTLAATVELRGETLVIHGKDGGGDTELVRATDPSVGPLGSPVGHWSESEAEGAPFLEIAGDGTFSGNDGCNALTGTWATADDGAVEFAPGAQTLKFCEGVDAWLGGIALGRIADGVMTLQDEAGTELGQLTRG